MPAENSSAANIILPFLMFEEQHAFKKQNKFKKKVDMKRLTF